MDFVQVLPATQAVGPLYPIPPHCPYLATVPPVGGVVGWEVGVTTAVEVGDGWVGSVGCGSEPPDPPQTGGPGTM